MAAGLWCDRYMDARTPPVSATPTEAADPPKPVTHQGSAAGDPGVAPRDLLNISAPGAITAVPGLTVRWPELRDAAAIAKAASDPEIARWTTLPQPYSRADAEEFLTELAPEERVKGSAAMFSIDYDGEFVGACGLHRLDSGDGGSIGYWLAPWARGRGFAAAALRDLSAWGFSTLGLRRQTWYALVGNIDSWRAAQAAGFRPEGTVREAMSAHGGAQDCWTATRVVDDPPLPLPRSTVEVEIAAGAWQLQPADSTAALLAEQRLPVSACLPLGLWAVREATTARIAAVAALFTRDDHAWVLAAPASLLAEEHHQADVAATRTAHVAVARYARLALGFTIP